MADGGKFVVPVRLLDKTLVNVEADNKTSIMDILKLIPQLHTGSYPEYKVTFKNSAGISEKVSVDQQEQFAVEAGESIELAPLSRAGTTT